MINLTIDGRQIAVPKGTTVYQATQKLGINVPIFCYQDRMPPFGACRVCLVEVEKMGKLQTSCTLEATEGMVVSTQSQNAVGGRKEILEFLLINHPLDCPICDRGGECPLQEQTLAHGPGESRFFEDKRRFEKAKPLGPVLMLDRERCIACARCTRFGEIVAGDHALEFKERGFRTEVGTPNDEPVKSKFIGNTIKICPVGALTSQVYRFRARPWDNQATPSTCTLCPVGCSTIYDSRDGEIMRTRSQENAKVNDIWMCDKGWFGYEYSSSTQRLSKPLIKKEGKLTESTWEEALELIVSKIQLFKAQGKLAGWGGNPLTTEENYLFQKLIRQEAGTSHVDHRIGEPIFALNEEEIPPGMTLELADTEKLSYAILFGLDLTEEFPVIWLRLKQAINKGAKVIFIGHYAPEIANDLDQVILHAPGDELNQLQNAKPIIDALIQKGGKGALFVGRQYWATSNRASILKAISAIKADDLTLNIMEGRGNSMGARFAGMRPDLLPFGQANDKPGLNAQEVLQLAIKSGWDFLWVAGSDPALKFASKTWQAARKNLQFLVVQDLFLTDTAKDADVVLPTLSAVEKGGSFINIEGRVQSLLPGKEIPESVLSDADIFETIIAKLKGNSEIDQKLLTFLQHEKIEPFKQVAANNSSSPNSAQGELKATFQHYLFDEGVRMLHNPHVIKLAKLPGARIHPKEAEKRSFKDGERVSVQASSNYVLATLVYDNKVAEGTVVLPLGFEELPSVNLADHLLNGLTIELKKENYAG